MSYEHVLNGAASIDSCKHAPITSELKKFAFKVKPNSQKYSKYEEENINADISTQFKKCGWSTMDLCMKWRCVQEYIARQNLTPSAEEQAKMVAALKTNSLKVTYNKSIGLITEMNINDVGDIKK